MGKCLFMRKGETHTEPVNGFLLSELAEGSLVKLNENGYPVDFYVAKHNYESSLNGTGRTLLVRKDVYDGRPYHSSYKNAYDTSDISVWLNGTYKGVLDSAVQEAISTTKFYYTKTNWGVGTLERSIFLLSVTELGFSTSSAYNTEGSALPIASKLKIATNNGSGASQWTRTLDLNSDNLGSYVWLVDGSGTLQRHCTTSQGSRPAFTIPSNALFDKSTLTFKGVA